MGGFGRWRGVVAVSAVLQELLLGAVAPSIYLHVGVHQLQHQKAPHVPLVLPLHSLCSFRRFLVGSFDSKRREMFLKELEIFDFSQGKSFLQSLASSQVQIGLQLVERSSGGKLSSKWETLAFPTCHFEQSW